MRSAPLLFSVITALGGLNASATFLTYSFTGVFDDNGPDTPVLAGDTFIGSFTLDDTAPSGPFTGAYTFVAGVSSGMLTVTSGAFIGTTRILSAEDITIADSFFGSPDDLFAFGSPDDNKFGISIFTSGDLFTPPAPISTPTTLGATLDERYLDYSYLAQASVNVPLGAYSVVGHLTSNSLSAVPEPSMALGAGLTALAALGSRRRRRRL